MTAMTMGMKELAAKELASLTGRNGMKMFVTKTMTDHGNSKSEFESQCIEHKLQRFAH